MAKGRRRPQGVPFKARINVGNSLSSLADATVLIADLAPTITADAKFTSAKLTWALREHTAGQGPIHFGLSHGDLSAAEVQECLQADTLSPADRVTRERTARPVVQVGTFSGLETEDVYNHGMPKFTRIGRWARHLTGQIPRMWVLNDSGANLTTGSRIEQSGTIYGRWV